ncbi:MAG TPA: thiamine diphosphokinase [Candidatus Limnocylindria bacterium]
MKAVVVAGGDAEEGDLGQLTDADLVIAADGGATWLDGAGRTPDLLVGDLDSAPPSLVERLAAAGVPIERHPAAKDATDAELAVDRAVERGADVVVVIGALGGDRLDHELANVLLVADPGLYGAVDDLRLVRGATIVRALGPRRTLVLDGGVGTLVSLLPIGGDAIGIGTSGLRFPLHGERLGFGRSRGASNVVEAVPASVSLERGVLLVIEKTTEGEDQ